MHSLASSPSPGSDVRRRYAQVVLAALTLLAASASAFFILRRPDYSEFTIYGFAALCYIAAALSQAILLPAQGSFNLRVRWYLWVGFLLLNAVGLCLAFLNGKGLVHVPLPLSHTCFSLGYALAYIVTINPPRSSAWRRLWLVDAILACVMGIIFFLVYRTGEPAGVYTSLLFAVAMQAIFAFGSLLSLRTADSSHARDLARYMLVYFILNTLSTAAGNLPHVWTRIPISAASDVTYAIATVGLALTPLFLQARFFQRIAQESSHARPLPPAAPVLITSAILLACLPLLHFNLVTGIALLVVAIGLYTLKVALLQTDFEHERTSLLQSNKQLRELAYIDPVTGIANRRSFMETARDALASARRGFGPCWLILFELDDLRKVFASSGRRAGELYLCDFVQLVRTTLDPSATHFAHISNGEFVLLLDRSNQQSHTEIMQRIQEATRASGIGLSAGSALATSSGPDTVERWLANAGTDLHRARNLEQHTLEGQ